MWERSFDAGPINTWMEDNGWIPLTACAFYMAAIVAGKMLMANRPAFELRRPLAAWNLVSGARMRLTSRMLPVLVWLGALSECRPPGSHQLLAAFSTMGMLRAVPHALTQLKLEGFHHLVTPSFLHPALPPHTSRLGRLPSPQGPRHHESAQLSFSLVLSLTCLRLAHRATRCVSTQCRRADYRARAGSGRWPSCCPSCPSSWTRRGSSHASAHSSSCTGTIT